MQKRLTLLLFFFGKSFLFAQQPAYFILGEDQFKGVQIYDIIQDENLNYFFGTNEGIFYYDYHNFKKIECNEAKSNSVFNFVMDNDGIIYCHNLNNQIFELKGSSCVLFYELKKEETKADISLAISNDNNLIVGAKIILVIGKDRKLISRKELNGRSLGPVFTTQNHEIQFHLVNSDSIITYLNGNFSYEKLNFNSTKLTKESVFKFFTVDNGTYAFDQKSKSLFTYSGKDLELLPLAKNDFAKIDGAIRIYETDHEVWAAGTFPGVSLFASRSVSGFQNPFYVNYFISNVYKDKEGNTLLGTFDKGVIVIPDLHLPDVINFVQDDPIISLYADSVNGLFMGSSKGIFISYHEGEIDVISDGGKHPIEGIYGNNNSELLIFDNGYIRAYNKNTKQIIDLSGSSLKDAAVVSDEEIYLGTNNGVVKVEPNSLHSYFVIPFPELDQRIYSIEYNPVNKNLYTSTADGLFVLLPSGKAEKIKYYDDDIFPNNLYYYDGKIFANTRKAGILIIGDKKVTGSIQPMVNEKTKDLKKISISQNSIIGSSTHGLFRFDMSGKLISSFHSTYRFNSKRIIDFALSQNELWVCHSGGVQLEPINYSQTSISTPTIRFDEIKVNDKSITDFKEGDFKNNERKIQFIFSSPTLKNREYIFYHYQLVGYDSEWKIQSYDKNEVTYNALAPGTYKLQLKSENQDKFSPTISYSFTIAKPVYANWWFIGIAVILFLIIVYLIYRWQLNIQNKKAKQLSELNASRLTALKSQMNPHFIFNSLNSIQDLVLRQETEKSYDYIVKFSDLVRQTLNFSDKDFIDFDDELKLLNVYLELEQLRFPDKFKYNIDKINVEEIEVPPMLVQPFIENAIKHGLLHKTGEKQLSVIFEQTDVLICTIIDNGVGRAKAREIKKRQQRSHESFSVKATKSRFEIMQDLYKSHLGIEYEDLYENSVPVGTKVVIRLPFKHKY